MAGPSLQTLREELADARQEVRNLVVMAMRPDQSKEKVDVLHELERSARAEVRLRVRALAHAENQRRSRPSVDSENPRP